MQTGPFLKGALVCENVIEDKQGVLSLVRIVDRIIAQAVGTGAPQTMPPVTSTLTFVAMFSSGEFIGGAEISVALQNPVGLRKPLASQTVHFEGQERGVNLILQMQIGFETDGLYWFEVTLDGAFVTRVPLRVLYTRLSQDLPRL